MGSNKNFINSNILRCNVNLKLNFVLSKFYFYSVTSRDNFKTS